MLYVILLCIYYFHMCINVHSYTVNDKSYEEEKFHSSLDFIVSGKNFCGFAFDKNKKNFLCI